MPSMSMNKVIHCAVRRDLDRFRRALETFTDADRDRAEGLFRAWANFDAQLTEHHEGEHEIAWPAMKAIGVAPPTINSFDAEHEAMAAGMLAARTAMERLRATASRWEADGAADAMESLQATTVAHLDHEEQETEAALCQQEDHPAIKEMGKKFSRRTGPIRAGVFFAWVQDGASADELAALRDSVPAPVMAVMGGVFGLRYRWEIAPVWRR